MDRSDFRTTADELIEHAEDPESAPEKTPNRPENVYTAAESAGYSQGGMESQQAAALKTNDRINAPYFEHLAEANQERQEQRQEVGESQKVFEQNVEQAQASPDHNAAREDQAQKQEAQQPEQQQEIDWQRYTQDKGYQREVNDSYTKPQEQTLENSRTR